MTILPLDDNLARLIGLVVAHWGDFECKLNKLIALLLTATDRDEPNWDRRGFEKRKKLLKELLGQIRFETNDDVGQARLATMLGEAADLQWRRNTVAHGVYRLTVGPMSSAAAWRAESFHNGKPVTVSLDPDTLEKLWHDIAHLSGGLEATVNLVGASEGGLPSLPDTHWLDLFRERDRRNPPKPQTP